MRAPRVHLPFDSAPFERGFADIRAELEIPAGFPDAVAAEADTVASRGPTFPPGVEGIDRRDRRDLPFVAIDPPGSRDIDQAYHAARRDSGYRLHYAIADLASFVGPGGAIDAEALTRGVTLYSPDERASLHPDALNEGAASLLDGMDRPALLWTIDLDEDGNLGEARLERALVRNRALLSYREAQESIDSGAADESLALLREIGELRRTLERERGAVSLNLPDQEVVERNGSYRLVYDVTLPVERWNAQISLLTGIAAARIMVDAGVGLLRTLPRPNKSTIKEIRRTAEALRLEWPSSVSYADFVRGLDPTQPAEAAMLSAAARGLRGAGYEAFTNGALPDRPEHSAIASTYAHVTAPLRRVCDRFANEVVLAVCGDYAVPEWALATLDQLPSVMGDTARRDRALERAVVDFMEAICVQDRIGEQFPATVTGHGRDTSTLQLREPPIIARIDEPELPLGQVVTVELVHADPVKRRVRFESR